MEARNSGNVYGTARQHDVQPNQIRAWLNKEQKLIKNYHNQKARSVHRGISANYPHLEKLVYSGGSKV